MKIEITLDNGEVQIHQHVTEYLLVTNTQTAKMRKKFLGLVTDTETRSFSKGGPKFREIMKETWQTLTELTQMGAQNEQLVADGRVTLNDKPNASNSS